MTLDGKFSIEVRDGKPILVKTTTGEPIPGDEPVMLLRARDRLALPLIKIYAALSEFDGCNAWHMDGISLLIHKFRTFKDKHPERMKQPGITRGL